MTNTNVGTVGTKTYTAADEMIESFAQMGVRYLFVNLGSDHPAIIESLSAFKQQGRTDIPEVIMCQHEMVALSAAHGYAQVTGKPQAVIVHVDCGTQNLGGAVHNAARGRIPVFIFAGMSPITQEGELMGSRNEYIHWLQDVSDQRGIVREYMKYTNEIRTGKNVRQLIQRSMQLAESDPKGPVYVTAAREVLEEEVTPVSMDQKKWRPVRHTAMAEEDLAEIIQALTEAKNPLIVTTYLGRNLQAVDELIQLSERLAIPVLESAPSYMNFPSNHLMHVGYVWNEAKQDQMLANADLILVIDSDVPWIPLTNRPQQENTKIYYIDVDPLKEKVALWYIPSDGFFQIDSFTFLKQLNKALNQKESLDVSERWKSIESYHNQLQVEKVRLERSTDEGRITPEQVCAHLRNVLTEDAVIMSEAITNFATVNKHLPRSKPGTYFSMGASSLGWNGGAAFGAKLANKGKLIVSLTGDGSYVFSNPTPVHWMSRKYEVPFLTVIFNNEQWNAPKFSTLGVHPNGIAKQSDEFFTYFSPSSDLAKVAEAAGGAYAVTVADPNVLTEVLTEAVNVVNNGRSAVVDIRVIGR
ncbi:thiamine pyrophosphate-requiring protein [Shouchella patagoniensis]|uniref:thiamine pyrophosphate-requiring protein n=1 Tax=Shouchella patagoniensis TaxID=228576 RepID=UPI001FE66447|nr:thiamine pyrophosphate-requiring protein [Shouchella patagoniensis]